MKQFGFRQSVRVVWQIGWSDFLLKYRGSALGYLWSFADPLVRFLVIYFVFRPFLGNQIEHYPLYLFLGVITWDFFVRTVTGCLTMLHDKAAIIQKIPFPRILLIYASGWTNTIIYSTHLCVYFLFALWQAVFPGLEIILLPILIILIATFSLGIGLILSSFALKFRDIPHLWQVAHQLLFWLTPVFYPYAFIEHFPTDILKLLIQYQPVSVLLRDIRLALLYGGIPTALNSTFVILISVIVFLAGRLVFQRRSRYFVQEY